jgi:hypothetical protein
MAAKSLPDIVIECYAVATVGEKLILGNGASQEFKVNTNPRSPGPRVANTQCIAGSATAALDAAK